MRFVFALPSLTALAVLTTIGCGDVPETNEAAASESMVINENCPIMTDNKIDPETDPVTWNGHQVGFCCPGCDEKFLKMSDEEKRAALVKAGVDPKKIKSEEDDTAATKTANELCPIMLTEVNPEEETATFEGKTIGFCCPGCKPKFEKMTDEEKKAALARAAEKAEQSDGQES